MIPYPRSRNFSTRTLSSIAFTSILYVLPTTYSTSWIALLVGQVLAGGNVSACSAEIAQIRYSRVTMHCAPLEMAGDRARRRIAGLAESSGKWVSD